MAFNPLTHNRNSIRLQGYDYSSEGAYFLTICTYHRQQLFGNIIEGQMKLNRFGLIAENEWEKSATLRSEIELGEYVIMPNHMHAIVYIIDTHRRAVRPNTSTTIIIPTLKIQKSQNKPPGLKSKSIGSLISGFKSSVTKQINIIRNTPGEPVWQRNYWDHIIRNDKSFDKIEEYIINNPLNWNQDKLFTSYCCSAERTYYNKRHKS